MEKILLIVSICIGFSLNAQNPIYKEFPLIPKPKAMQVVGGHYNTNQIKSLNIPAKNEDAERIGKAIASLLRLEKLKIQKSKSSRELQSQSITLSLLPNPEKPESYKLHITKNGIWVVAAEPRGWFYALQTLSQIVELNDLYREKQLLPYCLIDDEPRFPYRGLHLDVSRHFFPPSFIKQYIDLMARFKYNTFHWHLTDDQGWRIEIKKFPKLTETGAFRLATIMGHAGDFPPRYDSTRYGGFYTQEEIKEIISYANARYITIIPEIEVLAHSSAALASYPEFSCDSAKIDVATTWGVFQSGVFCTKDTSLWFIKEILNEVCALFPGPYIHIGGDECLKGNWKACSNCQAVKRRNKLNSEEELQSYFIRQLEKYLSQKGKKLIGWDEILEGGLSPNATVMSWRGVVGGIQSARAKHNVIMSPGSHCYFDHYQSLNPNEPLAIGGYTPISKTYSFEPVPPELKPNERMYVLGAQGNVWTEYMNTEKQVLYMTYPRAIALSEVNWTSAPQRDYANFLDRLQHHIPWFEKEGMGLTHGMLDLSYTSIADEKGLLFVFQKPPLEGKILIETTRNGDIASEYLKQDSFILDKDIEFKAWYQLADGSIGKPMRIVYQQHIGAGKQIQLLEKPSDKYFSGGPQALLNGIGAPASKYSGPEWIGMEGNDFHAIIDLGKDQSFQSVQFQFFHEPGAWIHRPNNLEISWSSDGTQYSEPVKYQISDTQSKFLNPTIPCAAAHGRYLNILIRNHGPIEAGLPGAGKKAWLFLGEIIVR